MSAKPVANAQKSGEVLVVGMGVAGIQASLDLTRLGFHVTAVEKGKTIGGIMAQLDKTFPTNDCSLCILAPKMVEVYRDPNITLYQNTELKKVEHLPDGNLKILLEKQNMGINESACKNCGECTKICPIQYDEPITWFDAGLARRKAVNIPFPSAVPPVYAIEKNRCLKAKHNACGKCQAACPSNAITYDFSVQQIEIVVGGIIFATGCTPMEPKKFPRFLGGHPDVLGSIQFERLMCASGPTSGEIIKRSNKKHASRIAFIQCVGSRSKRPGELEYCSSVCCMYAMKEAQITKEHDPHVECYIFNPENRACAKGFHEYFLRSRNEYGVKFMPGRVSRVHDFKDSPDLAVEFEDDITGEPAELRVDLVILATGLIPNTGDIAKVLGCELNKHGYFDAPAIEALESKGIYMSGYDIKPMDIPLSVVSGSAAAAKVSKRLNAARFSRIVERKLPKEKRVTIMDEPRIGVLVCHCGINIGRTVDCERVAKEVAKIPNVVIADHNYYSCSSDSQVLIQNMITEHNLNRFIVASCTPRTHESLFRGTLQEAGLNPYLFELVNIREHASWVHMNEPQAATEKAIELIKMNIAKARGLGPQQKKQIQVTKSVLIIGGGPAGLFAADNLANQDFKVYLVEKTADLGGATRKFTRKLLLDDEQLLLGKLDEAIHHITADKRITIFTSARVEDVSGFVGNYKVKIAQGGRVEEIDAGGIIVATGVAQDPNIAIATKASSPRIFTQEQFEAMLDNGKLDGIKRVGFIQCSGQRHDGGIVSDFPNCSGICCKITLKQAKLVRQIVPDASIYIMQRGMNLSGDVENEALFQEVQRYAAVARYDPSEYPAIKTAGNSLRVSFKERNSSEPLDLDLDALVLATPYKSAEGTRDLAMQLKVPVTQDGFMLEAHVKLRPVDFATEGVFVAGGAQWPKSLEDATLQGLAAAGRAIGLLAKGYVEAEGITAEVDESMCVGCAKCESVCPYRAIEMVPRTMQIDGEPVTVYKSHVIEAMCKGCGTCAATCPTKAIDQRHFKNGQVLSMIAALFENEPCTCCAPQSTAATKDGGEAV